MTSILLKIGKIIFGRLFSSLVDSLYNKYIKASMEYQLNYVKEAEPTNVSRVVVDLEAVARASAIDDMTKTLVAKQVQFVSRDLYPIDESPLFVDIQPKKKFEAPYFYVKGRGAEAFKASARKDFVDTVNYNRQVDAVQRAHGIPVKDSFTDAMETYNRLKGQA